MAYAKEVEEQLKQNGIRVELDDRDEKLGFKIREARLDKVPYMMIVGEKEQDNQTISVRMRDAAEEKQDLGEMKLSEFINMVSSQIKY